MIDPSQVVSIRIGENITPAEMRVGYLAYMQMLGTRVDNVQPPRKTKGRVSGSPPPSPPGWKKRRKKLLAKLRKSK